MQATLRPLHRSVVFETARLTYLPLVLRPH
jgi:hypothetical protein